MKFITVKNITELQPGDKVRSKVTELVYIVVTNFGDRVTAVRVADITNTPEWEVLRDVEYV